MSKGKIAIATAAVAACIGVSVFYFESLSHRLQEDSQKKSKAIEAAKTAYFKEHLASALQILEQADVLGEEELHKEGCELVLSIYSEQKRVEKIPALANRCILKQQAVVLAYDALAMSLTETGKNSEAIDKIKKGLQNIPVGQDRYRIQLTLAHTYLVSNFDQLAITTAVESFRNLKVWEPWATRWLKLKKTNNNQDFTKHMVELAMEKGASDSLKKLVLERIKSQGLEGLASKLTPSPSKTQKL